MKIFRNMAAALIATASFLPQATLSQDARWGDLKRSPLMEADLSVSGRKVVQVRVDFPPGVSAARHNHPGEELVYVIEGVLEYQLDGREPVTLKAGDTLLIPYGAYHAVKNVSDVSASELATYIVDKDKPLAAFGPAEEEEEEKANIDFLKIDDDVTLRRMIVRGSNPKGTVLFLHGFPETLYAWKDIALALASDYEVHAFDWPGFGRSSRPADDRFPYAPSDFARVLGEYIAKAGIDTSTLTIYATDIGALPALLLAIDKPDIAKTIIVGDFAPFDRPHLMYESLRLLKADASGDQARIALNNNRTDILENAFRRGLPHEAQFEVSAEFKEDMARGWDHDAITTADAFAKYYARFTRDQLYFESRIENLATPVKVVWGERDLYISKDMGAEFAERIGAEFTVLSGIGHYPHLQSPGQVLKEIRAAYR